MNMNPVTRNLTYYNNVSKKIRWKHVKQYSDVWLPPILSVKHGTLRHHSLTDLLADLPVLKKRKNNKQSVVILYKGWIFSAFLHLEVNFPAPPKVTLQQLKQLRKSKLNLKETNNNLQHK